MTVDYIEEMNNVLKAKQAETHDLKCELFGFESKLSKFDQELKNQSLMKKMFSGKKTEERNQIIEIIQALTARLNDSKVKEDDVKKEIIDYVRKHVRESNPKYDIKLDDLETERNEVKEIFTQVNTMNSTVVEIFDTLNNLTQSFNSYTELANRRGVTSSGQAAVFAELIVKYDKTYRNLVHLKHIMPITKTLIESKNVDIDLTYLDLSIKAMNDSEHENIKRPNSMNDFNNATKKINSIVGVTNTIYMLINKEAKRLHAIINDIDKNIKALNDELDVEVKVILRTKQIEI